MEYPFAGPIVLGSRVVISYDNKGVKSSMFMGLECVCAIWWIALLCRTMWRPLMCGFEHVYSRCGHVLTMLFGHSVLFGCMVGQKMFYMWLPMC